MATFDDVYQKWKKETSMQQENSDLFDADEMVDDFGKMIPGFFFRFVWDQGHPHMELNIRWGRIASVYKFRVDTSDELSKYIDRCNLNNSPFHYSDSENLADWWKGSLTWAEVSAIKKKQETIMAAAPAELRAVRAANAELKQRLEAEVEALARRKEAETVRRKAEARVAEMEKIAMAAESGAWNLFNSFGNVDRTNGNPDWS